MTLLTGGAGYTGSHVCIGVLDAGLDVVVVDTSSTATKASPEPVQSGDRLCFDTPTSGMKRPSATYSAFAE